MAVAKSSASWWMCGGHKLALYSQLMTPQHSEKKELYAKQTVGLYLQLSKKYAFRLLLAMVTVAIAASVSMYCGVLIGKQVDLFNGMDRSLPNAFSVIWKSVVFVVGIRLLGWMLWRSSGVAASYVVPKLRNSAETQAFDVLQQRSVAFFADEFTGSLVRKVRSYASSFSDIVENILWRIIPFFVELIFLLVLFSSLAWQLTLVYVVWVTCMFGVNIWYARRKAYLNVGRAARDSAVTAILADVIGNMVNVMLFGGRERERQAFQKTAEERRDFAARAWRSNEMATALTNIINAGMELLIMLILGWLWIEGRVGIGIFAVAQLYLVRVFRSMDEMSNVMRRVYELFADAAEMTAIIIAPASVIDAKQAKELRVGEARVQFQSVKFSYQKQGTVLPGLDLEVAPHEKIALVGPSGAGKTTVVKLLLRFYDIQKGKILVDGQDIAKMSQQSLRQAIGLVPQEPLLFHRSLKENIAYGKPDASMEEIIEAAKKAHCHEFITELPEGYETLVGERGVKLSGGERQRVAIARAILKNAPILILDEATSALDSESEHLIQDALKTLMRDKTVIVIAHRLSTIMGMDRIIVMEHGQITDQGTHQELTKKVGKYQELWHIQAGNYA